MEIFEHLLLLGRPASGKSEFIDYMQRQADERRAQRYHLGKLSVVDDFTMLWQFFQDDDVRQQHGRQRVYSRRVDPGGYTTTDPVIWSVLIDRINRIVRRDCLEQPEHYQDHTALIEFSRGREQGYRRALNQIDPAILERGAILYIAVSYAESWRRNIARYEKERASAILTHMVPHEAMEEIYSADDWPELAPEPAGILTIGGARLPYVTMDNEPESTDPQVLDQRYGAALERLWKLKEKLSENPSP